MFRHLVVGNQIPPSALHVRLGARKLRVCDDLYRLWYLEEGRAIKTTNQ